MSQTSEIICSGAVQSFCLEEFPHGFSIPAEGLVRVTKRFVGASEIGTQLQRSLRSFDALPVLPSDSQHCGYDAVDRQG